MNLGSGLRPVARAPAPGGARAWPFLGEGSGSKMLIFARFIKVLHVTKVTCKTLISNGFHGNRRNSINPMKIMNFSENHDFI